MSILGRVGEGAIARFRGLNQLVAAAWAVLQLAARPYPWRRTVRAVFMRQLLFTGFEAVRFVSIVAFMVGISIVVQTQVWLRAAGQSHLLGPVLVAVIVRELGPLLTNFIVIGRSGTAIATELGIMKVNGEVELLDAQGIDPFIYLVMTRSLGVAVSVFCLSVVFIVVSFASGLIFGLLFGAATGDPSAFIASVFGAMRPGDGANLLAKTLVPGLFTGVVCCTEGLRVGSATTEVPQAASRAVVRSVTGLFIVSALISLVTYL
jgi:phospholipid/cholesterol/gamma-HCH transport system permease protein